MFRLLSLMSDSLGVDCEIIKLIQKESGQICF